MEPNITEIDNAFAGCFTKWDALFCPQIREGRGLSGYTAGWENNFSERHLHAVWFDPLYRPLAMKTEDAESVTVEEPGKWNLEAGPDFINARLHIGGERTVTGDIEVHINPADWNAHHHAKDRLYSNVVAHVTYFPGTLSKSSLPPGAIQISLKEALEGNRSFSFDSIDITSYPFAMPQKGLTPCSSIVGQWQPEDVAGLLQAAGRERIAFKTRRLRLGVDRNGENQALYEETMTALGYKKNRHAFKRLARLIPFETLASESGGNTRLAYALLLGASGLLPSKLKTSWNDETRVFIRELWDRWWKLESVFGKDTMSREDWDLSSLRPHNHPARRMAAAAAVFTLDPPLSQRLRDIGSQTPAQWIKSAGRLLDVSLPFWDHRLGLSGRKRSKPVALIGAGRNAAIISNVFVPFALACGYAGTDVVNCLPKEQDNSLIRLAAYNLLGPDHNPAIYAAGLYQQGLMQILQDYCLQREKNCAHCRFLNSLRCMEKKFTL